MISTIIRYEKINGKKEFLYRIDKISSKLKNENSINGYQVIVKHPEQTSIIKKNFLSKKEAIKWAKLMTSKNHINSNKKRGVKMSNSKLKGWYNDSIRHSLARKGIKTKIEKKHKYKKSIINREKLIKILHRKGISTKGKSFIANVKDVNRDEKRIAKPVGKRISENGNTYYEYRLDRADINPNKHL